jgi:hypothetical protein
MIARVTKFQARIDRLDEVKKIYDEAIFPAAKAQKGFNSGYLLIDRKTGDCVAIGFWDNENAVNTDEKKGHLQERVNMIKDLWLKTPVPELYEVSSIY